MDDISGYIKDNADSQQQRPFNRVLLTLCRPHICLYPSFAVAWSWTCGIDFDIVSSPVTSLIWRLLHEQDTVKHFSDWFVSGSGEITATASSRNIFL